MAMPRNGRSAREGAPRSAGFLSGNGSSGNGNEALSSLPAATDDGVNGLNSGAENIESGDRIKNDNRP